MSIVFVVDLSDSVHGLTFSQGLIRLSHLHAVKKARSANDFVTCFSYIYISILQLVSQNKARCEFALAFSHCRVLPGLAAQVFCSHACQSPSSL